MTPDPNSIAFLAEVFRRLNDAGWYYTDGDSDSVAEILEEGDEQVLTIRNGDQKSFLLIIPGLDGAEVLADHGDNIIDIVEPVYELFDI